MIKIFVWWGLLVFSAAGNTAEVVHDQYDLSYQVVTNKPFAEVLDDAVFAITERNFRLVGHLHIGKAIRDRGTADFMDYEVLLYCNLSSLEEILVLDARMINFCPGRINIRQSGDQVFLSASLWPNDMKNHNLVAYMRKMNALVYEIVDYATQDWFAEYER